MPRGDKDKYTDKQKRKAEHIEESYEAKGVSKDESQARAWATVNKQSGGVHKGGSGQKTSATAKKKAQKSSGKRAAAIRKGEPRPSQQLEDLTKAEFMDRARKHGIAGRSTMRKPELVEALHKVS